MRLIDADAIPWQECLDTNGYAEPLDKVISVIQNMPTIEAIPVEWIEKQKSDFVTFSMPWIVLAALLETWKEKKNEVEE